MLSRRKRLSRTMVAPVLCAVRSRAGEHARTKGPLAVRLETIGQKRGHPIAVRASMVKTKGIRDMEGDSTALVVIAMWRFTKVVPGLRD